MSSYLPIHDRPPYFGNLPTPPPSTQARTPRYGSPDLDPEVDYPWVRSMAEDFPTAGEREEAEYVDKRGVGPSRKRPRTEDEGGNGSNGHGHGGYGHVQAQDVPIIPSIFGIAPRNEFTKTVGEFIMHSSRGRENVEIEIKLGTLTSVTQPGEQGKRIRMPAMSEMIMPADYPIGGFVSNMNKAQNASLNRLLNSATASSQQSPFPIHFYRAQHIDSFHSHPSEQRGGGKVRVSRDRAGNVVENGVIRKKRIGDLNVYSPREAFDFRVSVSLEEPCEMPGGPPRMVREKDRACYRHQLCQVDLTNVTTKPTDRTPPSRSFELEIEILDVPTLIAEGEKEERGEPNRFDEILQSCLDTARMLIRNVEG